MITTKLLAFGACALAFAGMASAQTTVVITGSSAFRAATHTAIVKILNGTVNTSGATPLATLPAAGGTGGFACAHASNFTSANSATFRGYLGGDSTKPIIIKTSWTGSAAGVQTVASTANSYTVRVLPAATALSTTGTFGLADPTSTSNPADLVLPDVAMADNRQTSTPFTGTFNDEAYTTLTATRVGVVAFQWVRSRGASTGITNMTPQIARALWTGNGTVPLSFFTGVAGDATTLVYATGRDGDSGTRIVAFAESGIGITSGVQQYDCALESVANVDGAAGTPKLYASQTVNGVLYAKGRGGEKSGGTLVSASKMGLTTLTKSYVSYVGASDASAFASLTGTSQALTYNGVPYSVSNIQQGLYTFWGYEYLMYKPSLAGDKLTTATTLASQILNVDAPIKISSMAVTRGNDGSNVTK